MIRFVMLWKVNFFNKTNGLKIAPVYIWQRIECLSKDHLVPNFELFQGFVFNPIFHWVRKFDRFLSEWIADLSNELYLLCIFILGFLISHIFSLVLSCFFQDPVVFLCLLGFHLVPGFVLFCLYQLSVTVKSHFITPLYKK